MLGWVGDQEKGGPGPEYGSGEGRPRLKLETKLVKTLDGRMAWWGGHTTTTQKDSNRQTVGFSYILPIS